MSKMCVTYLRLMFHRLSVFIYVVSVANVCNNSKSSKFIVYLIIYTRTRVTSGKCEQASVCPSNDCNEEESLSLLSLLLKVTLPTLAFRAPQGINFVYAACDYSLLVLAMFNVP